MLTGDLLRARLSGGAVRPAFVDPDDPGLLARAEGLVATFEAHAGSSRGELRAVLEARTASEDAGTVRLERGLAKLLEDRSTFEGGSTLDPEAARALVYERAAEARAHGVFDRSAVLARCARELSEPATVEPAALEVALEADRKTHETLLAFEALEPRALLVRYNVALVQAVLLRAVRLRVRVEARPARVRALLRAAKFRRLLFRAHDETLERDGQARRGLVLELDGPLSLFGPSTKYGLALAEVLPAVLLCERFSLEAEVAWGRKRLPRRFALDERDLMGPSGKRWLVSHLTDHGAAPPRELEAFARRFEEVAPGWKVDDEVPVLFLGEGELRDALVPDLRLVHEASGREGFLELLTAARRGSVARRLELLRREGPRGLVVAVERGLVKAEEAEGRPLPASVVVFRSMPVAKEVLARLEAALARRGRR